MHDPNIILPIAVAMVAAAALAILIFRPSYRSNTKPQPNPEPWTDKELSPEMCKKAELAAEAAVLCLGTSAHKEALVDQAMDFIVMDKQAIERTIDRLREAKGMTKC
jgi:hypothetical protein